MQEPSLQYFLSEHNGGFGAYESFAGTNFPEPASGIESSSKGVSTRVAKEMLFWMRRFVREAEQTEPFCKDRPEAFMQVIYLACHRFNQIVEHYGLDTLAFEDLNDKEVFLELQKRVKYLEGVSGEFLNQATKDPIHSFLFASKLGEKLSKSLETMRRIVEMGNPGEFISYALKQTPSSLEVEDELKYMTRSDFGSEGKETYEQWKVKKDLALGILQCVVPIVSLLVGGKEKTADPLSISPEDLFATTKEDPLTVAMENPDWVINEVEKWATFRDDFVVFLL